MDGSFAVMNLGFYHDSAGDRQSGGIAVFVREMAMALADEHDVYLYTKACDPVPELVDSPVTVVHIPVSQREDRYRSLARRYTPFGTQNVTKFLMFYGAYRNDILRHIERNVDVLLTSQWPDDLLLSNALQTPTVYEFHGFTEAGLGTVTRHRLSQTRYTLANSHQAATSVHNELGVTVDEIIYPGVDISRYTPEVEPAFESEYPVVLFVGRITEDKGTFDLLDAFEPLSNRARLHIVGRGDTERVMERARQLGISNAVHVEGVVPEAELPGYFTASDVFCLPSHYEGVGMVNLESMACGTPVVTTDVGGIPEYATDEKTALLAPPKATEHIRDNLRRLIESPKLRRELGTAGHEVAQSFSWQSQAQRLAKFCETVS